MITFFQSRFEPDVLAFVEGSHVNIYFDFELAEDDMYKCRYVHLNSRSHKDILAAIIQEKYSYDDAENILLDSISEPTDEYWEFSRWRSHAKEIANQVMQIINE